jgi:hypothetical protein
MAWPVRHIVFQTSPGIIEPNDTHPSLKPFSNELSQGLQQPLTHLHIAANLMALHQGPLRHDTQGVRCGLRDAPWSGPMTSPAIAAFSIGVVYPSPKRFPSPFTVTFLVRWRDVKQHDIRRAHKPSQ